ncbi:MAG: HigA family addiction module antidote protein [Alphaproteobacteria bacterium]|nr:HigA family addiction module antidote protein [Alphaproteobacteria bacterium]
MTKPKNVPKRDPNRCPSHPGAVLREIVLPELRMSKTDLAKALKMSRQQLHAILREQQPVTPDTAVKLAAAFGGSAQAWLNMQSAYDLWHAERRIDVSDIPSMRAA